MAMELLAFHYQFVANFPPDDEDDNFVAFNIIQGTQLSCSQLVFGERVWSQPFDRFHRDSGLILQPV
jgi:hypothetical protein